MSLLLTFIVMRSDYSLDNLSLMALTLAIGSWSDDAIVFLETSSAEWRTTTRLQFVRRSTAAGDRFTIVSMTLSLAAVFLRWSL